MCKTLKTLSHNSYCLRYCLWEQENLSNKGFNVDIIQPVPLTLDIIGHISGSFTREKYKQNTKEEMLISTFFIFYDELKKIISF